MSKKSRANKVAADLVESDMFVGTKVKRSQKVIIIPEGSKTMSAAYKTLERNKNNIIIAKEKAAKAAAKAVLMAEKAKAMEEDAIKKEAALLEKNVLNVEKTEKLIEVLTAKLAKQIEIVAKTTQALADAKELLAAVPVMPSTTEAGI